MKIFDLMKKAKVKKIGVRLCNSVEDVKKKRILNLNFFISFLYRKLIFFVFQSA